MAVQFQSPGAIDAPHHPFDRSLSLRLDALILQLDARPGFLRCWILRGCKRLAERQIPAGALDVRKELRQ